jgi:hypothetical protein
MEVLFEKIRGSCWVDRGSQHGFFNGRGGGLIENEKKERKREREKERKRERVGFENNSTFHNFTRLENETKIFFAILTALPGLMEYVAASISSFAKRTTNSAAIHFHGRTRLNKNTEQPKHHVPA